MTSPSAAATSPGMLLTLLRQYWSIENRVHWPRDVSWHEDRYHGQQIGTALAWLRNVALNLIRRHRPGRFIPDVWSKLAAQLPMGLRWLLATLMNWEALGCT